MSRQYMKSLILKFLTFLYSYYNSGRTSEIAYSKTIMAFLAVLLINYFALATVFKWPHYNILAPYPKLLRFILFSIFVTLPFYFITSWIFPESKILNQLKLETRLKQGRIFAFGYIGFSILILVISILKVNNIIF